MYQPTSTPARRCDEDLPLSLTEGSVAFEGDTKGSKYGLHMLAEGCSKTWFLSPVVVAPLSRADALVRGMEWDLATKRISLACSSFGNYHGRKFRVRKVDGWGIKVTRIS